MKIGLREIVFTVLLAALPLGSWWFVFRPSNAQASEATKSIEAKQAKLGQLNKTLGTLGDIQQEIDGLQKGVSFLQAKLPNEKEIDKVLQEVWRLAESNQLTTKSIRTLDKSEATFVSSTSAHAEQPIVMKLEGDFRGFYSFLLALENQPRIMRIRKMTLLKPEKSPDGFMQATIEMTIFFDRIAKEQP